MIIDAAKLVNSKHPFYYTTVYNSKKSRTKLFIVLLEKKFSFSAKIPNLECKVNV